MAAIIRQTGGAGWQQGWWRETGGSGGRRSMVRDTCCWGDGGVAGSWEDAMQVFAGHAAHGRLTY
jgi:hypothetical protein